MEYAIIILVVYAIFKLHRLFSLIINKTTELAEDSIGTYSIEVSKSNAKKRVELDNEISSMDTIPSIKDLEDKLKSVKGDIE